MRLRCLSFVVGLVVLGDLTGTRGSSLRAQAQEGGDQSRAQELVLETAETIQFTTDEVTWPSVSVSPDGRTIVFDVLGDLYTLPTDGGTATRIVGGLSFESQPVFSPDGKTIAFLSDRSGFGAGGGGGPCASGAGCGGAPIRTPPPPSRALRVF